MKRTFLFTDGDGEILTAVCPDTAEALADIAWDLCRWSESGLVLVCSFVCREESRDTICEMLLRGCDYIGEARGWWD